MEKDPQRPFIVQSRSGEVRAVGTAFTVHQQQDAVQVSVVEGIVEVSTFAPSREVKMPAQAQEAPETFTEIVQVVAGEQVVFDDIVEPVRKVENERLDRHLAWHRGAIIFKGETLSEAIEEVSRYTTARIIISEPALRDLRIGGYFKTDDIDGFLRAIELGFDIKIRRIHADLIYLGADQTAEG